MLPLGMPVMIGVCAPNRPPSMAMVTTRLSEPAVKYAYSTGVLAKVAASMASPSSPPSPPGSTPWTVPTVSTAPPAAGIRLTSAVSRSLMRTDPSGSTAPLHGTCSPVAVSTGAESAARAGVVPDVVEPVALDEPTAEVPPVAVPAPEPEPEPAPEPLLDVQPARASAPRAPTPSTARRERGVVWGSRWAPGIPAQRKSGPVGSRHGSRDDAGRVLG